MIDRRTVIGTGLGSALGLALSPRLAFAKAATNRRFIFIIQRGAADGLGIVAPIGDPAFADVRRGLAEDFGTAVRLDSTFALHPSLAVVGELYGRGQALFAHAVASPYRDRSHFDGQNVLETGGAGAYRVKDGWLNRMLDLLPAEEARAIALAVTVPLALRGGHEVSSYAPSTLPDASDGMLDRVSMLYQGDSQLHALWSEALETRALTTGIVDAGRDSAATGALAAKLLAPDNGARIIMIETGGWDTHAQQRTRLAMQLRALDALVGALRTGLGPLWADTMVLVATEFGRTVAINGTGGTDHGTASAAMLFGGGLKGGRVIADWPGLGTGALFEGRDLKPTMQLDSFIAGAVAEHFVLEPRRVMAGLFPDGAVLRPTSGLVRS